ncbi:MAG: beta-ketoacyl synthase N-terminal-like domain-containing protein, partial [Tumebacillaceae bacterium]
MNNEEEKFDRSDEIAIIGMAGRFPDAQNIEEFWQNLAQGVESVTFFTDEELLASGVSPAQLTDPNYVKAGCILDDVETFDAAFFGYSPREVEIMDPQHRLFLEAAWETLEHAGYDTETYPGAISLFGGTSLNKYLLMNLWPNQGIIAQYGGLPLLIGSDKDFLTTRVSYKLNLKGASVNVQTACSTSLVAIHMAVQSLLNGECEMAMAGGVSVIVPQKIGYGYVEGGTTSPDGHCRAFDENAKGTIPGSGVAMVLLKRLEDALADGDTIHAVIKGSAINNDGSGKVGYTAPSVDGEAGAVGEALAIAGIAPETVTYVETHGTATPLGDPIEIAALT